MRRRQRIALALSRWQGELDLDRRYVCLLNPDTVLDSRCMERVIAFMDAHPDVMIAGPKLLRAVRVTDEEGDEVSIERSNVIDSAGITIRKSRVALDRGAGEEDRGQYDHDEPFGISGATMVIRASAIPLLRMGEEGEVFDEDFFAYKEDADLSWRARLLGMRITLIPEARIWHHRSAKRPDEPGVGSTVRAQRARSPLVNKYSHRNQIWMEWKNDDTVNRLLHLPWRIPQLILRCGACLLLPQHLKAVIEAWMGRSRMAAKRKELMARRKVDAAEMRKWFV
jgi:GT2 family glycosyltransferase